MNRPLRRRPSGRIVTGPGDCQSLRARSLAAHQSTWSSELLAAPFDRGSKPGAFGGSGPQAAEPASASSRPSSAGRGGALQPLSKAQAPRASVSCSPRKPELSSIAIPKISVRSPTTSSRWSTGSAASRPCPSPRGCSEELHEQLMRGVRGDGATPGEFRRTQNSIGRPGQYARDGDVCAASGRPDGGLSERPREIPSRQHSPAACARSARAFAVRGHSPVPRRQRSRWSAPHHTVSDREASAP